MNVLVVDAVRSPANPPMRGPYYAFAMFVRQQSPVARAVTMAVIVVIMAVWVAWIMTN